MNASQAYAVLINRSILEISAEEWDSINCGETPFHSHRFLRVVEASELEQSQFWYIRFYYQDQLISTAVLSSFVVDLGLFLDNGGNKLLHFIRRRWSSFLKPKVLVCGLPISLGQKNWVIPQDNHSAEVAKLLVNKMLSISKEEGISELCAKEFLAPEAKFADQLLNNGFFKAYSIPYMQLLLPWQSFEDYLESLRSPYRRKVNLSRQKIEVNGRGTPQLVIGGTEICKPEVFHQLYLSVMARAETKLETLNLTFFENFFQAFHEDLVLLGIKDKGQFLSLAILFVQNEALYFLLVGRKEEKDPAYDSYFNLIYGILDYALEKNFKLLHLGQTAYEVKQRLGGIPIDVYLYYRSRKWWVHLLLKQAKGLIFPETILKEKRVFKGK